VTAQQHPVVLIAEDNPEDVALFRRAFEQLGYGGALQYVFDGEEAIAYLAGEGKFKNRSEFPLPSFLLLDLKMPRKTGFDVLDWIRSQAALAEMRTVVLTTSDDLREVSRAYQSGAASFLTKPVNFTEFKDTIQALFNYWLALNKAAPMARPGRLPSGNPYQSHRRGFLNE
jgi:CheY-like chemotaxis protein